MTIFTASAMMIILLLGWGVIRLAMANGSYDAGSFFVLNGFVVLIIAFIILITVLFLMGL